LVTDFESAARERDAVRPAVAAAVTARKERREAFMS
jgi:hypothetical protein